MNPEERTFILTKARAMLDHATGARYCECVHDERTGKARWKVHPLDIVPLCPAHHRDYDAGKIDLLPYLTVEEQVRVVQHLRGIENARMRLAPLSYREVAA